MDSKIIWERSNCRIDMIWESWCVWKLITWTYFWKTNQNYRSKVLSFPWKSGDRRKLFHTTWIQCTPLLHEAIEIWPYFEKKTLFFTFFNFHRGSKSIWSMIILWKVESLDPSLSSQQTKLKLQRFLTNLKLSSSLDPSIVAERPEIMLLL